MSVASAPPLRAPWRALVLRALGRERTPTAKYLSLATVGVDGRPACRTVVFRGFLGDGDELTFVTDARSGKVAEIARAPFAEACWYLAATREQFRLAGALAVVGPGCGDAPLAAARARAWGNLSDAARAQFSWPQPGLPLPEEGGAEAEGGAADGDAAAPGGEAAAAAPQPGAAPPLDTFCLLVLSVSRVDWLRLRGNQRSVFERRGGGGGAEGWTTQAVTP